MTTHGPSGEDWISAKDQLPKPWVPVWIFWESRKCGPQCGYGYYINEDHGWAINGSSGGPKDLRPPVLFWAKQHWPEGME
jgi:hypothetical protein